MSCVVLVAPVGLERSGSHTPSIHSSPTGVRRRRAEAPRGAGGGGGGGQPSPARPRRTGGRSHPSHPPEQFPCFIPAEPDFSPFCTFVAAAPPTPLSPSLLFVSDQRGAVSPAVAGGCRIRARKVATLPRDREPSLNQTLEALL